MNNIQVFSSTEFSNIRMTVIDGEPIIVLGDICKNLKLNNVSKVALQLDKDNITTSYVIDSLGRKRVVKAVTEAGLYEVIFMSRKPEAKAFKHWVTHEVLPSIRKTGSYSVEQTKQLKAANDHITKLEKELEEQYVLSRNFDRMLDIFERKIEETVSLQEEVDRLKAKQTRALPAPKVGAAEGTMSTVQAAKLLQMHYPFVNRDWIIYTLRNADCMCQNSCEPTANGIRWGIVVPKLDVYFKNGVKTIGRQYSHITSNGFDWLAKVAKQSAEKELV